MLRLRARGVLSTWRSAAPRLCDLCAEFQHSTRLPTSASANSQDICQTETLPCNPSNAHASANIRQQPVMRFVLPFAVGATLLLAVPAALATAAGAEQPTLFDGALRVSQAPTYSNTASVRERRLRPSLHRAHINGLTRTDASRSQPS
eukprot:364886-Chlamydomonas_euryale.AAC.12